MKTVAAAVGLLVLSWAALAGEISFSAKPTAARDGDKVKITFTVSAPTDVEVAVLDPAGKVVRHLAAGVLGAKNPPPEPLVAGLAQSLVWDGKDDAGKPPPATIHSPPFKVCVRAIQNWTTAGRLAPRDLPGRWKFLPQDLEAFLVSSGNQRNTTGATDQFGSSGRA